MTTPTNCSKCNAPVGEDAVFCAECGNKIEIVAPVPEMVFCSECGAKATAEKKFCPQCGKPFIKETPEASLADEKTCSDETNGESEENIETSFCPECGTKITAGDQFCPECGKPFTKETPEASLTDEKTCSDTENGGGEENIKTSFCPECGTKITIGDQFCPECGKVLGEEAHEKKKRNLVGRFFKKPVFIGSLVAVVVLVIALTVLISKSNPMGGANLIYLKEDKLQFTYLSKLKPFELSNNKIVADSEDRDDYSYSVQAGSSGGWIQTSDNGRYILYPGDVSSKDDSYTYYWRDLKVDNSKKDTSVKVASGIVDTPFMTKDGSKLFYIAGEDRNLYVYERKSGEKSKLDSDVASWHINDSGDYLIYSKYIDGESVIFEMAVKGLSGEKTKLDSNSEIKRAYPNEKKVYYTKEETLYFKEAGKDKEKISSNVTEVKSIIDGAAVYYTKREEITDKLSAFIEDDIAGADGSLAEPSFPGYPPEPEWPSSYNSEDFDEIYDKYEQDVEKWIAECDKIDAEYETAYQKYNEQQFRNEVREQLDDSENAVTYNKYSLYYWNQGKETLVASDIVENYEGYFARSDQTPAVLYQKYDVSDQGQQKLSVLLRDTDEYTYVGSIIDTMRNEITESRKVSEDVCVALADKETTINSDKATRWSFGADGNLYFLNDYNDDKGYGTLAYFPISKGTIGEMVKIDEDVERFCHGNGNKKIIYVKDVEDGMGEVYMDGKFIAADVYIENLYHFKDSDTFLYLTDYSDDNMRGTLSINKGGKATKISDDVSSFVALDSENIFYLTDYNLSRGKGDLMLYNGKKKATAVDTDVRSIMWDLEMYWNLYFSYQYF